jgi:PAS domain S-box-containing protein
MRRERTPGNKPLRNPRNLAGVGRMPRARHLSKLRLDDDARFRSLVELLPAGVYTCEAPAGIISFYNAQAAKLWGRAPRLGDTDERFCGSLRLWRPDGSPLRHDETPMARAICEGRSARNEEVVIERPDGSRITVLVNVDALLDAKGAVVGAVNVFYDTTKSKLTEEARARLAAIVESSDDAILSKDLNGTITSWNRGAERIFGYRASEVIGKPVTVLFPPDRYDEEPGILERVRRGEPVRHYETVRQRKDGSRLDVSLSVSPVVDDRGKIVGASSIARDVTEQNRAAARASFEQEAMACLYEVAKRCAKPKTHFRENLSAILDAALWITRADKGNLQLYEKASGALKLAAHRGFEAPFLEFFATVPHGEATACGFATAAAERVVVEDVTESPIFADPPSLRALLDAGVRAVQSTPLVGGTGTVLGMISTHFGRPHRPSQRECQMLDVLARQAADYVERTRAEEQREELLRLAERAREEAETANRAKDEFLAMLGHELRNPLSAVRNSITSATLDPGSRDRALEIARRQTDQLVRIVDDLLDVARITRGRVPLRKERAALADVLRRSVDGARATMDERGHSLELSLPAEAIHFEADPARIEQAVGNLLSNAAKYTDPGGTVTVTAERDGRDVLIRIRDNGVGIAPEVLPRIFDLFTQGPRSLDRAEGGLGMGLTLVRRIVELHGGTVAAKSGGLGRGAEFVIRLPALPPTVEGAADEPRPAAREQRNGPSARVLIVEDNPDAAEGLEMILELLGHHVRVARDGKAGLEAARANVPNIVLVDIGLPGMDGYDVARAMRRDPALKDLVLVALTGYGRAEDAARAMAAGFDYHLVKPVDLDRLGNLLSRLARPPGDDPATADESPHAS